MTGDISKDGISPRLSMLGLGSGRPSRDSDCALPVLNGIEGQSVRHKGRRRL